MNRTEAPYPPLTDATIAKHLLGGHHIGFYPLLDDDTTVSFAAHHTDAA